MLEGVSGVSNKEGILLYDWAKRCEGKGVIVEIGSWKGGSTIWLAKGSKAGNRVKVFAIDPHVHGTFEEFKRNIKAAGVDDIVVPIIKTSEESARDFTEPVELIFIDGDHSYEAAKLDFKAWFPKLVDGGLMAFHDATWNGVKKVVGESVCRSSHFKNVSFLYSILSGRKVARNSLRDRLRNRYIHLLIHALTFVGKLRLLKLITVARKIITLIQ